MLIRRIIWSIFRSVIGSLLVFAIVVSGCIIWFGPLLAFGESRPLESPLAQGIAVGCLWLVVLLTILLVLWLRARRNRAMTEDIVSGPDPEDLTDAAVKAELGEVRAKMRAAMVKLRKAKGRKSLAELPWYLMIGPPGAGKTTAIVNSGLQFPLAEEFGRTALDGVGGTRNCDWWFTDNAVMIDTAGRFTTQESDAAADSGSWLGFLGMLKKHRPRQPINGAIVALSLADLSMQDEVTQKNQAKAVRRRLQELREKLGVRFPVYIVFTKSDLIVGFSEFFENLGKEAREQVWGFTLPVTRPKAEDTTLAAFDGEFDLLLDRLNRLSLDRMQQETDHQRRSLIAGFPAQVASIRQVARDFLTEIFVENKYEARQFLRGVYFTSGTQEGTPIDRLMMGMARSFGIGRQAIGSGRGQGRSFFLTRLFDGVIFHEAGLVSADDKVERMYRWTLRGAMTAVILAALGMGAIWTQSYRYNRDLVDRTAQGFAAFTEAASKVPGNPVADTQVAGTLPALENFRTMPANSAVAEWDSGLTSGWGLDQGAVLADSTAQAYHAALVQIFLPRLLLRLEEQLSQLNGDDSGSLYDALKVYLNLGGVGTQNPDLIRDWLTKDWEQQFAGETQAPLRAALLDNLNALLSQEPVQVPLNGDLIATVRQSLQEMQVAERVYRGIIDSPEARALPAWTISAAAGPQADKVFVRASGAALSDGVPGIYTYDGFQKVFKAGLGKIGERVEADGWVLADNQSTAKTPEELALIERDVLALYESDFINRYEDILKDVDIRPIGILSDAVEVTRILSSPSSPLRYLLQSIAVETVLTREPDAISAAVSEGAGQLAAGDATVLLPGEVRMVVDSIRQAQSAGGAGEKPKPGSEVQKRFQWLVDLSFPPAEGTPAPVDNLIGVLDGVSKELNKMQFTGGASAAAVPEDSAIVQLQMVASGIGGPVERWAGQIASGSSGISAEGTRASIDARWKSTVLAMCEQVTANRYPFEKFAPADVGLADFAKLFGPGGLIDTFFNENLAAVVDTTQRPWVLKAGAGGASIAISETALAQLQAAADIRQAFFPNGPTPQVTFQLTPHSLDKLSKSATLEIDGQKVEFDLDNPTPVQVVWPGDVGFAQLSFLPEKRGTESNIRADGPWALFRLMDAASPRRTAAEDRLRIYFTVGQRIAIVNLQSTALVSPFYLQALSEFTCPKSF
ncbi:type VI secretion system membrane subunit TssM [Gemmobacter straminiformis]|uniref:Type VI secretion system membrane subunit TssM n=2 Tax=Paragemmobacter straminiformis TaxID=2045119 RepID=A0A842I9D4_9RHOB|nr:type VI secretion system membrane subunit TssM [Gemmobacter straminiformis]